MKTHDVRRVGVHASLLLVGLALWMAASLMIPHGEFFLSDPVRTGRALIEDVGNGSLIRHWFVSASEIVSGLTIGTIAGWIIGVTLWADKRIGEVATPYIAVAGTIPVLALAPIVVIWLGIGYVAKICIVAFSVTSVTAMHAFEGARSADRTVEELLRVHGIARRTIFTKIILPSSFGWVFAGMRVSVGLGILGAFVGEFIASNAGLGYFIIRAMGLFDTTSALVGVFGIIVLALSMLKGVELLQRAVAPWSVDPAGTVRI